jgi:hypothetical protein
VMTMDPLMRSSINEAIHLALQQVYLGLRIITLDYGWLGGEHSSAVMLAWSPLWSINTTINIPPLELNYSLFTNLISFGDWLWHTNTGGMYY